MDLAFVRSGLVGLLALGIGACGGSGSGSGSDPGPAPEAEFNVSLTPTPDKLFRFNWSDVSGETEYRLLENPDGASGFAEVAIIPADTTSYDLDVFLPERINASYILQACDADGCTDSDEVFVTGNLATAVGQVRASNAGSDDRFGFSAALSGDGNTLAVGAYLEDSSATGTCAPGDGGCATAQADDSATDAGAVYVFTRSGSDWTQQAYVKAFNAEAGDYFGHSLSLSDDGNTLAVGSYLEDSNASGTCVTGETGCDSAQENNAMVGSGAAYVFTRSGSNWSQAAYLKASNGEVNDQFAYSLVLSGDGNTLAASAVLEDSNGTSQINDDTSNAGATYVFARSGSDWFQQAYLKARNAGETDRFGHSLAISDNGNTLAVGAYLEDSDVTGACPPLFGCDTTSDNNLAADSGAVNVFTRSGSSWALQAYIKASNTQSDDNFGRTVALSDDGDTLAVGAYGEASGATGVDGSQVDNSVLGSGAVYLFSRSGVLWNQQAYVKPSNTGQNDRFSDGLALSGDGTLLAAGAAGEDSSATGIDDAQNNDSAPGSGAVYLFVNRSGVWSQKAYIKASDTQESARFGTSVQLADDNNTLAVGAPKAFTDESAVYLY